MSYHFQVYVAMLEILDKYIMHINQILKRHSQQIR